jgi:predicted N-formylglutamate amidohydrolase
VSFVVTCEHARNGVPPSLRGLFRGKARLLSSHKAYDPGAQDFAHMLARALEAPFFSGAVSRLVVDLNRSLHHSGLFSRLTRGLSDAQQRQILLRYYRPYRLQVESEIASLAAGAPPVVHFSCHSFAPVRNGVRRRADLALLYDPSRPRERALCDVLKAALVGTGLQVRRNYPYRGVADGFTTHLRRRFSDELYAGVEVEINQALFRDGWPGLRRTLVRLIAETAAREALRAEPRGDRAASSRSGRRWRPRPVD